ncbi:hypothetical protein H0264_37900 [Nocardia huaxiensis]|uniref:IclR-ED domain-containing protein n=1 Tax=Nocardia huaxiensis TaxID=2755382 RepID=A0A7D6V9B7_9NOCA|nr:hypothetical protein H0264_37900 [Nocardia huaxiensis]
MPQTRYSLVDRRRLGESLVRAHDLGRMHENEQSVLGMSTAAAVIRNGAGEVTALLAVACHSDRAVRRLDAAVARAAEQLEVELRRRESRIEVGR